MKREKTQSKNYMPPLYQQISYEHNGQIKEPSWFYSFQKPRSPNSYCHDENVNKTIMHSRCEVDPEQQALRPIPWVNLTS